MGDSDEEIAAFDRLEEKVSKWKAKRAREGKPHGPEQEKRFRDYLLSQQRPQNTQAAPGPVQPPPQMNHWPTLGIWTCQPSINQELLMRFMSVWPCTHSSSSGSCRAG